MRDDIYFPIEFILLLAGLFAVLVALVLIYQFYKSWRIQRLVSPRKDYTYKQKR